MTVEVQNKAAVTVSEMARMVGLSRARFYQLLQAGVFPQPVYDVRSRRPLYVKELQQACHEVRQTNCGIDGKPVPFYGRRLEAAPTAEVKEQCHQDACHELLDGLRSLGLPSATAPDLTAALSDLFPAGISNLDQREVLRAVFLHLQRQSVGAKLPR
jgi:hypothetical protein